MTVRLEPWGELGFTLLGAHEFEYPPGNVLQCNDWQLDLNAGTSAM